MRAFLGAAKGAQWNLDEKRPVHVVCDLFPFNPLFGELREMSFIWDRPYIVNHDKFVQHFGDDWTPLEEGLETTLNWYRENA